MGKLRAGLQYDIYIYKYISERVQFLAADPEVPGSIPGVTRYL
jgi:hypothetical protein